MTKFLREVWLRCHTQKKASQGTTFFPRPAHNQSDTVNRSKLLSLEKAKTQQFWVTRISTSKFRTSAFRNITCYSENVLETTSQSCHIPNKSSICLEIRNACHRCHIKPPTCEASLSLGLLGFLVIFLEYHISAPWLFWLALWWLPGNNYSSLIPISSHT